MGIDEHTTKESPLIALEDLAQKNSWGLLWSDTDEIMLEVQGKWTENQVFLIWRPESMILHMSVSVGLQASGEQRSEICQLLVAINERQWAGHFDLCSKEGELYFRHSLVGMDPKSISPDFLQEMIDMGINEAAIQYPVFDLALSNQKASSRAISLAMIDVVGNA